VVEQARVAAEAGHAVIVDATFLDPAVRVGLERAVAKAGNRFLGVWLVAPLSLLEERIAARRGDASDATVEVLRRLAQDAPDAGDWLQVDASDGRAAVEAVRDAIVG
jgi:uncharacterized protein